MAQFRVCYGGIGWGAQRFSRKETLMAAGDITFVECPYGDSFPVRKTASPSTGTQQVVCPKCGHFFQILLPESVERMSQDYYTI